MKELLKKQLENGEDVKKLLSIELERFINEYRSLLKDLAKKDRKVLSHE